MGVYTSKVALLGNIVDYAGTFPPAALPLEAALHEAATCRDELRHPWLYSKMALPMNLLTTLSAKLLSDQGSNGTPWLFTALGTPIPENSNRDEFARVVEWDLRELGRFNDRGFESSGRHWAIAYETKLPVEAVKANTASEILKFLEPALVRFSAVRPSVTAYFEVPLDSPQGDTLVRLVADALCEWTTDHETLPTPGIKIRTGGKVLPSAESLASAVIACTSRRLRFKATQGLHHAISGKSGFGFVNLFSSLALAQALGEEAFGPSQVEKCLQSTSTLEFQFLPNSFRWNSFEIEVEALEAARRLHGASFGSCSIKEPDEFLATEFPDGEDDS